MRSKWKRTEEKALPPPTTGDAVQAIHGALRKQAEARSMWPRINRVSGTLYDELEENDFAGRFRRSMGGA